jgi:HEAT repeat protein
MMNDTRDVDETIARYLQRQDSESASALAATGERGVHRVLDVMSGDAPFPAISGIAGRDAVDRWSAALSIVAQAAPAAFIDRIAGRTISRTILAILGDVDDARAVDILGQHLHDTDWLSRYNAVTALERRPEPSARDYVEAGLDDPNLVVRSAAIKAVSHWDPPRALTLYSELLTADGLTPLLRSGAQAAIGNLQAGKPVNGPGFP